MNLDNNPDFFFNPSSEYQSLWDSVNVVARPGELMINNIVFIIPPTNISVSQENLNHPHQLLRSPGVVYTKSSQSLLSFSLKIPFVKNGYSFINDEVSNVGLAQLSELIYQIRKFPFVVVENELIRSSSPITSNDENIVCFVKQATIEKEQEDLMILNLTLLYVNYKPFSYDWHFATNWDYQKIAFIKGLHEVIGDNRTFSHALRLRTAANALNFCVEDKTQFPSNSTLWNAFMNMDGPVFSRSDFTIDPFFDDKALRIEMDLFRAPVFTPPLQNKVKPISDEELVLVSAHTLEPYGSGVIMQLAKDTYDSVLNLANAFYLKFNKKLLVTDMYRTLAMQASRKLSSPDLAAEAGSSFHNYGRAADFQLMYKLVDRKTGERVVALSGFLDKLGEDRKSELLSNFSYAAIQTLPEGTLPQSDNYKLVQLTDKGLSPKEWVFLVQQGETVGFTNPQSMRIYGAAESWHFQKTGVTLTEIKAKAKSTFFSKEQVLDLKKAVEDILENISQPGIEAHVDPQSYSAVRSNLQSIMNEVPILLDKMDSASESTYIKQAINNLFGKFSQSYEDTIKLFVDIQKKTLGDQFELDKEYFYETGKILYKGTLSVQTGDDSGLVIQKFMSYVTLAPAIVPIIGYQFPTVQYTGSQTAGVSFVISAIGQAGRESYRALKALFDTQIENSIVARQARTAHSIKLRYFANGLIGAEEYVLDNIQAETSSSPDILIFSMNFFESSHKRYETPIKSEYRTSNEDVIRRVFEWALRTGQFAYKLIQGNDIALSFRLDRLSNSAYQGGIAGFVDKYIAAPLNSLNDYAGPVGTDGWIGLGAQTTLPALAAAGATSRGLAGAIAPITYYGASRGAEKALGLTPFYNDGAFGDGQNMRLSDLSSSNSRKVVYKKHHDPAVNAILEEVAKILYIFPIQTKLDMWGINSLVKSQPLTEDALGDIPIYGLIDFNTEGLEPLEHEKFWGKENVQPIQPLRMSPDLDQKKKDYIIRSTVTLYDSLKTFFNKRVIGYALDAIRKGSANIQVPYATPDVQELLNILEDFDKYHEIQGSKAYPDFSLPVNPITGSDYDTNPDFFMFNYQDSLFAKDKISALTGTSSYYNSIVRAGAYLGKSYESFRKDVMINPKNQRSVFYEKSGNKNLNEVLFEQAEVEKVIDGDTIKVKINGKSQNIRIEGLFAPELEHKSLGIPAEAGGEEARKGLEKILLGKKVDILVSERSYNRLVGLVYLEGKDIRNIILEQDDLNKYYNEINADIGPVAWEGFDSGIPTIQYDSPGITPEERKKLREKELQKAAISPRTGGHINLTPIPLKHPDPSAVSSGVRVTNKGEYIDPKFIGKLGAFRESALKNKVDDISKVGAQDEDELVHNFSVEGLQNIWHKYINVDFYNEKMSIRRMFPSYKLYIIDGDRQEDDLAKHFYDNAFSVEGIQEIRLVQSRKIAADLLVVKFVDPYGKVYTKKYIGDELNLISQEEELNLSRKHNPLEGTIIRDGAIVQFRLGYDNNPLNLPVKFNGRIVAVEEEEPGTKTIIAQSFAVELTSRVFGHGSYDLQDKNVKWDTSTENIFHALLTFPEVKHFGYWDRKINFVDGSFKIDATGRLKYFDDLNPNPGIDNVYCSPKNNYYNWYNKLWVAGSNIITGLPIVANNMSIWDLMKEMENRHPGWICSVVPYEDRMTVFFGAPTMPYFYRSAQTIRELSADSLGREIAVLSNGYANLNYKMALVTPDIFGLNPSIKDTKRHFNFKLNEFGSNLYESPVSTLFNLGIDATFGVIVPYDLKIELEYSKHRDRNDTLKYWSDSGNWQEIGNLTKFLGISSSDKEWKNNYKNLFSYRVKPSFRDYHLITSEHDIIANNLRADARYSANQVEISWQEEEKDEGRFTEGPNSTIVTADDNISPEFIRTRQVDCPNVYSETLAQRYGISYLCRELKELYKGSIVCIGDPTVKPYDRIFLADSYNSMNGPLDVQSVTHIISPQTGYIMDIVPDMVVTNNEFATLGIGQAFGVFAAESWGDMAAALFPSALMAGGGGLTSLFAADKISTLFSKAREAASLIEAGGEVGTGTKILSKLSWIKPLASKNIAGAAGLAIALASLATAGYMGLSLVKFAQGRNPVVIQPLMYQGKPFIIGLEGFEVDGLVSNYKGEWRRFLSDFDEGLNITHNNLYNLSFDLEEALDEAKSVYMGSVIAGMTGSALGGAGAGVLAGALGATPLGIGIAVAGGAITLGTGSYLGYAPVSKGENTSEVLRNRSP